MRTDNHSADKIRQLCELFEQEWKTGRPPFLATFLGGENGKLGTRLIEEIIAIDLRYRLLNDIPISPDFYAAFGQEAVSIAERITSKRESEDSTTSPPSNSAFLSQQEPDVITSTLPAKNDSSQLDRIGYYKLLQKIGEGGMGVVWMAEQEQPVRRRVALKLIKSEFVGKEIVARFESERQALAMMNHQNIAKVLDAGATDSGTPFFVMELVKGIPITEYCDRNKLSIEERLRLFVPVCKAIQHAHQKGIVHRDS